MYTYIWMNKCVCVYKDRKGCYLETRRDKMQVKSQKDIKLIAFVVWTLCLIFWFPVVDKYITASLIMKP